MHKLLIIDGNNLLFQMFYGMPSKIYNKSGQTIHATIGFISFILRQIKQFDFNRVVVIFDGDCSLERINLYDDYKANRTIDYELLPADEVPFNEEENIIKCLDYLNIKTIYAKNMEADDLIASLAKLFEENNKIVISSFDSDFFQLINKNVNILRCRGKNYQLFDELLFKEKFGFDVSKYVLYKSIVGDSADNILGVNGIGKIRGTKIVQQINSIDELNQVPDSLIDAKIKINLLTNFNLILRNISLIKLNYKQEVQYSIDDFKFDVEKAKLTNSEVLSNCNVFN